MSNLVSIVLPVYNAEKYIAKAIYSCLNQTYKNIELILVIDCPTDGTEKVIEAIKDPRIRIIKNPKNMGVIYSLNTGFKEAKGSYIARMDNDDICFPDRIETQLKFMEEHQNISLIGSNMVMIDSNDNITGRQRYTFKKHEQILCDFLFRCPFNHPATIFNRSLISNEISRGIYNENYFSADDYELWSKMLANHQVANLESPAIFYRRHPQNISSMNKSSQKKLTFNLASEFIQSYFSITLPPRFFEDLQENFLQGAETDRDFLESQLKTFKIMENKNSFFKTRFNLFLIDGILTFAARRNFSVAARLSSELYLSRIPLALFYFARGIIHFHTAKYFFKLQNVLKN